MYSCNPARKIPGIRNKTKDKIFGIVTLGRYKVKSRKNGNIELAISKTNAIHVTFVGLKKNFIRLLLQ